MNFKKISQYITKFDWSARSIGRLAVAMAGAVVALALALSLLGFAWRVGFGGGAYRDYGYGMGGGMMADLIETSPMQVARNLSDVVTKEVYYDEAYGAPYGVSIPEPVIDGSANAEEWESRSYDASYRTRNFTETCAAIADLKPLEHVVFLNANSSDRYCSYTFNVASDHEDEVVATLKALTPSDWYENTVTLERSVEDTRDQVVILERRLASLSETLAEAEDAYDAALAGARGVKDYASIAQIVNNKVSLVERITKEKLAVQAQIDAYTKNLGRTTDRVDYTRFSVNVEKRMLVDWRGLGDSWRYELDAFISQLNDALQELTFGLVMLIIAIVRWLIYIGAALFVIRLVWLGGKRILTWTPEGK